MSGIPSVIVFDVNETLSDMAPMAGRFKDLGAPELLAKLWFATLLRDGFALTASGGNGRFADIGAEVLRGLLPGFALNRGVDDAVAYVMQGMTGLTVHPDVAEGIHTLKAAGFRLVTLTNGGTNVAENLFAAAGIRDEFELLLSVEDAPAWKPAHTSYDYAAAACGVSADEMLLVAVHPWDINGASRAGLGTAWLNRDGARYPGYFTAPDHTVRTLLDLPGALTSLGTGAREV
ncbi:MAG: haloacid dehalogenase type II [Actinomycetota bacterium]|nr:haloacid dehalogenase type II [Actinomycetota bacterium]